MRLRIRPGLRQLLLLAAAPLLALLLLGCAQTPSVDSGAVLGAEPEGQASWVLRLDVPPPDPQPAESPGPRPAVVDLSQISGAAPAQAEVLPLTAAEPAGASSRLAAVFGLEGSARSDDRSQGGLVYGDPSGLLPSLTVTQDGQWQYSSGQQALVDPGESACPDDASSCTLSDPSEADVSSAAQRWLRRVDPEARAAPWQVEGGPLPYASAQRMFGNTPSGLVWGFGLDSDLELVHAHGWLVSAGNGIVVDILPPDGLGGPLAAQLSGWLDPTSAQTPSTFVVGSAEEELVPLRDAEGVWWLVPGYRFQVDPGTGGDTLELVLPALADRHVSYVGGQVAGDPSPDQPSPERLSPDQVAAVAQQVVGLTEEDAISRLVQQGLAARVVSREGQALQLGPQNPSGQDLSGRVNLVVVDAVVVSADPG